MIGIDLGSTTTKAVLLGEEQEVLGRGITNSRSNYDLAAAVARAEAFVSARFYLLRRAIENAAGDGVLDKLFRAFRLEQMLVQLGSLRARIEREAEKSVAAPLRAPLAAALEAIFRQIVAQEEVLLAVDNPPGRSDFFRDTAGSAYIRLAEETGRSDGVSFDLLVGLYDKCIVAVENEPFDMGFDELVGKALARIGEPPLLREAVNATVETALDLVAMVGTGYGRARLPFPKEQIRSEILCHGLGAHAMFPGTRTVLDIGGQDTKAIQVDGAG
ncbi:MAG: BadF/BadG/BcrA/BcrD ATPase family protein, partial [Thermoanaerobaculales bacterium]